MGKTLYLDCFAGISGDMAVGCLLDLGADREKLRQALKKLPLKGFETAVSRVSKSGLDMCDFAVILDKEHENHDHDMEYLHGEHYKHDHDSHSQGHSHEEHHSHDHEHVHEGGHSHEHSHGHHHDGHSHAHRGLPEINQIIQEAAISERAKETARRIFDIIGDAEAEAHGVPKDQVHFHEVGAVDSIVDIVAVAVCLDDLDITDVIIPSLCEGKGMVRCQHGMMPVPVPAVVNIAKSHHLTLETVDVEGELVTPTGAAIAAAVRTADVLPKHYQILAVGMGAGKRTYERPGILRGMLIENVEKKQVFSVSNPLYIEEEEQNSLKEEQIWKLESNIDDMAGEGMGYVMEELLRSGARDVYYIPVYMKKNRPACLLNIICAESQIEAFEKIVFENTTTIGIRKYPVSRSVLKRQNISKETCYGTVNVKECILPDGRKRLYPEYESVRKICREKDLPYWEVYQQLLCEF